VKRLLICLAVLAVFLVQGTSAQTPPKCLPSVTTAPVIDGVVATDPFHLHNANSDLTWAASPYQEFSIVQGGAPGSLRAAIFAAASIAGGKPDHLYLGVHVEGAEQFSSRDVVTIYVDSDGDGTPNFALQYTGVGPNSTAQGVQTNQVLDTPPTYFTFNAGTWQAQALPAETKLKSRTAWNFGGGPITGIWELEIDANLTSLGVATGTTLKFGAKLYVAHSNQNISPVPFDWPVDMIKDLNPNDSAPGAATSGGADPNSLDSRSVPSDNLSCIGDLRIVSFSSHSNLGDNTFYRPKSSDFQGDNLPEPFQTSLFASASFVNTGDVSNQSPLGGTNTGNIRFTLMPWGAGAVDTFDVGTASFTIQNFGTPFPTTMKWPATLTQWSPHSNAFLNLSDHVCYKVSLEGFTVDGDTSNNAPPQINLSYMHMSTHRDKFLIHALGTASPGAPKDEYLMNVRWNNVSKSPAKKGHDDDDDWWHRLCAWFHHREKWQAKIINSSSLGLKPLGGGYYSFKLAPGQEVTAEIELSGAAMPVTPQVIHVSPRAGGKVLSPASGDDAVAVSIPDGGMITVVATGRMSVSPGGSVAGQILETHNANGFPTRESASGKFLLSSKVFVPWQVAGALIGAFSPDFSDSFFIGTDNTFYGTPGATKLYLAVNDVAGAFGDNSGEGFEANVIATPPTPLPTKLSWPANPQLGLPGFPQTAANLPMLAVDVMKVDPVNKAVIPAGNVVYAAYASNNGNTGKNAGGNVAGKPQ
jgi:hypothetical protein